MMGKTPIAEQNKYLLNSKANKLFKDILYMSDQEFSKWVKLLSKEIVHAWDELGSPPKLGLTTSEIVLQFKKLVDLDVSGFLQTNELTLEINCIVNNHLQLGSCCNSFFPDMGKTKDITSANSSGISIYDLFSNPKNFTSIFKLFKRNFKEDSHYKFSKVVKKEDHSTLISEKSAKRWIEKFTVEGSSEQFSKYDFYVDQKPFKSRGGELTISKNDIDDLFKKKIISKYHFPNSNPKDIKSRQRCRIRFYAKDQKVFPFGFNFFQTGIVMSATNFPPATAKFIYKNFTENIKDQKRIIVYDPSSGFGGRILGALSLNSDRQMHYVGTDPNPNNFLEDYQKTRYEYLADFFNSNIRGKYKTTYELFRLGSEVIDKNKEFMKYKGEIDFIFTSPPYFAAEGYSEDKNQSSKKFPIYSEWRDGFLMQTLKTCVEYLKPNRWLLFNIADVNIDGKYYPLENDTISILESLGMKLEKTMLMVLANSPGGNRVNPETRLPSALTI